MNAHSTPANYMATGHGQAYATSTPAQPSESESRIDKTYFLSVRGILKFACLLFSFVAFVCLVATPQCYSSYVFLATVAWLVIIMQVTLIIVFTFRLQTKFPGIDFEFLDFFATSHDALYLLIASSVQIHYCRLPGQVAGGTMGILAFAFLVGDAVAIFLARRQETAANTNSNGAR